MDRENINTLKILGVEMINEANSGHPGIVLGSATTIYTLFTRHLNIYPSDDKWINRDRFVMSAGHGSALLYSMLHLSKFNLSKKDIQNFRQMGSKTPGHPEYGHTSGVDSTTGPLGQGIAMAVGMAMAENHLSSVVGKEFINHKTYVLCGDGDLQEGISFESMSIAGKNKLSNLVILHDSNDIQLDSDVETTTKIDLKTYVESLGFYYQKIDDGESIEKIDKALSKAKKSNLPSFIEIKTIIGKDSSNEGTTSVHGAPLGNDEVSLLRKKLKINWNGFDYPSSIREDISNKIYNRVENNYKKWKYIESNFSKKYSDIFSLFSKEGRRNVKFDLNKLKLGANNATRNSSGKLLDFLQEGNNLFFGGSVDLTASTKVRGINGVYSSEKNSGNDIKFGVREFASAAIVNGISLHGGLIPFTSTFFTFSDYMKPAMRLSSLMNINPIYIFTHDSVFVGEDGPTHEPIEQLTLIRSIPNFADFRPADTNELMGSWLQIMDLDKTPSGVILTRQNLNEIPGSSKSKVKNGAYIIYGKEDSKPDIVLFATGSEVELSIKVAKELEKENFIVRVISIPSAYLFDKKGIKYYKKIVDKPKLRVTIEASESMSLSKYISPYDLQIRIDGFGLSGEGKKVYQKLGFDENLIVKKILKQLS